MLKIKLLIIGLLAIVFSSCASVSEYNQGCRDGVRNWVADVQHAGVEEIVLEKGCNNVELQRERDREIKKRDMSVLGRRH